MNAVDCVLKLVCRHLARGKYRSMCGFLSVFAGWVSFSLGFCFFLVLFPQVACLTDSCHTPLAQQGASVGVLVACMTSENLGARASSRKARGFYQC